METLYAPVVVHKWMLDSKHFIVLFYKCNQTHKSPSKHKQPFFSQGVVTSIANIMAYSNHIYKGMTLKTRN